MTNRSTSRAAFNSNKRNTSVLKTRVRRAFGLLGMLGLAAATTGCGQTEVSQTTSESSSRVTSAEASPFYSATSAAADDSRLSNAALETSPLVGVWMGKAILNEQALHAELDSMSGEDRNELIRKARTFVSTQMAIEFLATGDQETAIEVQPVGKTPISGQTRGKWRIVETSVNGVIVETTEQDETGVARTKRTAYAISADGNRIVLQPSVGTALSKCEPLIYLDRQVLKTPEASIARQRDGEIAR